MNTSSARIVLQWCVCLSMAGTLVILFWVGRDGGIGKENMGVVGQLLADMYLPLLGIMTGFYFSERADPSSRTSLAGFIFASMVVAVWFVIPLLLLALPQFTVEDVISYLRASGPYGEALVAGTLTFYFSRESRTVGPPAPTRAPATATK